VEHRVRRIVTAGFAALAAIAIQLVVLPSTADAASFTQPTQLNPDVDNYPRAAPTSGVRFGRDGSMRLRWHGYAGCTVTGTEGPDVIQGTPGADVICALGGNDTVYGGGGDDRIYGGPGDDQIHGDAGLDTIYGDEGGDLIFGNAGNDQIYGDDIVQKAGEPGGPDIIYAGADADGVTGGPGSDVINTGSASPKNGIDVAHGGDGNDIIIGGGPTFSDQFSGDAGNDVLFPFPLRTSPLGNDVIGGDGADVAVLVNGMLDGFTAGKPLDSVSIPLQACKVTVAAADQAKGSSFSCSVGNKYGSVSIGADTTGKTTVSGSFLNGLGTLSASQLGAGVSVKVGKDVCACDPQIGRWPGDLKT
jgi:hypothetical protein